MRGLRIAADLVVLTGSPGTGKTAILDRLGADIARVGEPAREILAEQRSRGGKGTSDRDPRLFVELLLERSIEKYRAAVPQRGVVLFDRGIPDCIAYAEILGADPKPSIHASEQYRYHAEVLVLEPWEEIYTTDEERTMSFADTIPFHEATVDAYTRAGYALVTVPRDAAEARVAFVRDFITRLGPLSLPPDGRQRR